MLFTGTIEVISVVMVIGVRLALCEGSEENEDAEVLIFVMLELV